MAFQPMVGDMAGEIILRANEVAARNKLAQQEMGLQRQQMMQQSMGQLGQAVADWQKTTALKKQNLAELETWGQVLPEDVMNKLTLEKDENKVAGQLQVLRYLGEMEQRKQLAAADNPAAGGWSPSVVDLGNGNSAMMTSPRSAQLLPDGSQGSAVKPRVIQGQDGFYSVDPATGMAVPVMGPDGATVMPKQSGSGAGGDDRLRKLDLLSIDQKLGDLEVELQRVATKKAGWFARKPEEIAREMDELEVKRRALLRPGGGQQRTTGPVVPTQNEDAEALAALEAAQDAVRRGADVRAVNARLKDLGMPTLPE